jgi:hypothetical protein
MAIIPQKHLFKWNEVERLDDLHRLRLVLEHLPDEPLMKVLERARGLGRNDYPIRAVWNSLLAGTVFQHNGIESLRRELQRNAPLRELCGFDVVLGVRAVPTSCAYTRFLRVLKEHVAEVQAVFQQLLRLLMAELEDFGRYLAHDAKAIPSCARAPKNTAAAKPADGRRETDADWGSKTKHEINEQGVVVEKTFSWYGFKVHLIVDATYDLPVAFQLTKASWGEQPVARSLYRKLAQDQPKLIERCEAAIGDRGTDDTALIVQLWDEHGIKPIIAIRHDCKQELTRRVSTTRNVIYDQEGTVSCCCMSNGEFHKMAYAGFEQDRQSLKYRCPARHYGLECPDRGRCHVKGAVRIKLSEDPRVFTPIARSSYAWKRLYNKRSSVERVNSRLDRSFGFQEHFIRGQRKMELRLSLATLVMLAMAHGRIKEKQKDKLRSLIKAA